MRFILPKSFPRVYASIGFQAVGEESAAKLGDCHLMMQSLRKFLDYRHPSLTADKLLCTGREFIVVHTNTLPEIFKTKYYYSRCVRRLSSFWWREYGFDG